jgi:ABC-type transporter Mla MlaB component
VIFDLAEVRFLDSTGVGILMMCQAKLKKAGGALRVARKAWWKKRGVSKVISLYRTATKAAKDFQLA